MNKETYQQMIDEAIRTTLKAERNTLEYLQHQHDNEAMVEHILHCVQPESDAEWIALGVIMCGLKYDMTASPSPRLEVYKSAVRSFLKRDIRSILVLDWFGVEE